MKSVSTWVKPLLTILAITLLLIFAGLVFATSSLGDMKFLDVPIGSLPVQKATTADMPRMTWRIVHVEPIKYTPPKPRVQQPTRLPALTGTKANGSSNRYVSPWGCEASHAQQWSPSRKYWGKYQFDRPTWEAHGGKPGEYGSASESTQDEIAAKVQYDAWPNC